MLESFGGRVASISTKSIFWKISRRIAPKRKSKFSGYRSSLVTICDNQYVKTSSYSFFEYNKDRTIISKQRFQMTPLNWMIPNHPLDTLMATDTLRLLETGAWRSQRRRTNYGTYCILNFSTILLIEHPVPRVHRAVLAASLGTARECTSARRCPCVHAAPAKRAVVTRNVERMTQRGLLYCVCSSIDRSRRSGNGQPPNGHEKSSDTCARFESTVFPCGVIAIRK